MTQPSILYQLLDSRLDGGLPALIEKMRPTSTWQEIADEIGRLTGTTPNRETVRLWFADRVTVEVKVA